MWLTQDGSGSGGDLADVISLGSGKCVARHNAEQFHLGIPASRQLKLCALRPDL